jgi:hydrogenase nickel incorporation protein HypA/HybF
MHELSIATQILESLLEFAESRPGCEVLRVRLEVGELMSIEGEQLSFCYDSIKQGTPLEKSALQIEFAPAAVECPHCQYQGRAKYWEGALASAAIATLQCPQCGKTARAVRGQDCAIKSIQLRESLAAEEGDGAKDGAHDECDPVSSATAHSN